MVIFSRYSSHSYPNIPYILSYNQSRMNAVRYYLYFRVRNVIFGVRKNRGKLQQACCNHLSPTERIRTDPQSIIVTLVLFHHFRLPATVKDFQSYHVVESSTAVSSCNYLRLARGRKVRAGVRRRELEKVVARRKSL